MRSREIALKSDEQARKATDKQAAVSCRSLRQEAPEQFTAFLKRTLSNLAASSIDGSIHFIFMDWRHLPEILAAGECRPISGPRTKSVRQDGLT